jgi:hypothetical protein
MPTPANPVWRPSHARAVLLDSFVPVPRGAAAIAPPPLSWPAKDPADVLDYQLDIAPALIGNDGDAIASLDVAIVPDGPGDLALVSSAADGASAVLWLAGGQAGVNYAVTLAIVTRNNRSITRVVRLPVLALSSAAVPDIILLAGPGAGLTDESGNPITVP